SLWPRTAICPPGGVKSRLRLRRLFATPAEAVRSPVRCGPCAARADAPHLRPVGPANHRTQGEPHPSAPVAVFVLRATAGADLRIRGSFYPPRGSAAS